jgi:hypothetical protein
LNLLACGAPVRAACELASWLAMERRSGALERVTLDLEPNRISVGYRWSAPSLADTIKSALAGRVYSAVKW